MPSPDRIPRFLTTFPTWFLGLYRQPLVALTSLILVPLLLVCAWLSWQHERHWRDQESQDLLLAARLAARIIQEEFARTQEVEQAIASRPEMVTAIKQGDRRKLADRLAVLVDLTPMIDRAAAMSAEGEVLVDVVRDDAEADASETGDVAEPLSLDQPLSGVSLRNRASGEKVVTVTAPVFEGERVAGAILVQYRLQEIARWVQKVRVEPGGFIYVVDQEGFLAVYPFQVMPGKPKNVSEWPPVAATASLDGEIVRFQQGTPPKAWTAAVVKTPGGWRVIAQQPDDVMLLPLRQMTWSFAGVILILAGMLTLLLIRWAKLHEATLRLVEQQSELLKRQQQERLRAAIARKTKPPTGRERPNRGERA